MPHSQAPASKEQVHLKPRLRNNWVNFIIFIGCSVMINTLDPEL